MAFVSLPIWQSFGHMQYCWIIVSANSTCPARSCVNTNNTNITIQSNFHTPTFRILIFILMAEKYFVARKPVTWKWFIWWYSCSLFFPLSPTKDRKQVLAGTENLKLQWRIFLKLQKRIKRERKIWNNSNGKWRQRNKGWRASQRVVYPQVKVTPLAQYVLNPLIDLNVLRLFISPLYSHSRFPPRQKHKFKFSSKIWNFTFY